MPGRLVHIPLWWVIVGVMTCILTPILSIVMSVHISGASAARTTAEQRKLSCDLDYKILGAFKPTVSTGVELRNAFLIHYRETGCKPEIN